MNRPDSLIIVGAGGHGRGILEILRAAVEVDGSTCPVRGFLDDAPGMRETVVGGLPVLGTLDEAAALAAKGCRFLLGIGDPRERRRAAQRLQPAGVLYATAIHPRATLYGEVLIAPGCVVAAGAVVAAATRLETHALVNLNATVGHDCILDPFATVGPGANLGGNVRLGEAAFVGMNGTVLPGRVLGREAQLGAGSVLLVDLEAGCTAFGVPARVVARTAPSRDES